MKQAPHEVGVPMKLSLHEISTPLWVKLEGHYTPMLKKYRARIENPRISEVERIELAWKIAGIKEFLSMAEPEKEQKSDAE